VKFQISDKAGEVWPGQIVAVIFVQCTPVICVTFAQMTLVH